MSQSTYVRGFAMAVCHPATKTQSPLRARLSSCGWIETGWIPSSGGNCRTIAAGAQSGRFVPARASSSGNNSLHSATAGSMTGGFPSTSRTPVRARPSRFRKLTRVMGHPDIPQDFPDNRFPALAAGNRDPALRMTFLQDAQIPLQPCRTMASSHSGISEGPMGKVSFSSLR